MKAALAAATLVALFAIGTATAPRSDPDTADAPARPAPARSSSTPPAPVLDTRRSSCADDELADTVDVRLLLENAGGAGTVRAFVKRTYRNGKADGSAIDLADVDLDAGEPAIVADTYPAGDAPLERCELWLEGRFVEVPIRR